MEKILKSSIPNLLTIFRLFIAIIVICFLAFPFGGNAYNFSLTIGNADEMSFEFCVSYLLAGILFIIGCLTDFLDGWIARKYKWISDFGKFWDPIADKILINSVLIFFAVNGSVPVLIPVIMIIRDCIVDGRRMIHAKEGTVVAANWFGKWKTILQMVGISIIFFLFNTSQPSFNSNNLINLIFYFFVQNIAVIFALILSIISGFIYFFKNKK